MNHFSQTCRNIIAATITLALASPLLAQRERHLLMNEQGTIQIREHAGLNAIPNPAPIPPTVSSDDELPNWDLSLDEAIRIAMQNADAVRVLSGVGAGSTGQTIYSPGISNAGIDAARAVFDPTLSIDNRFAKSETPSPFFEPTPPAISGIGSSRSNFYDFNLNLSKRFLTGADTTMRVGANRRDARAGFNPATSINPTTDTDVEFSINQPLLRGRGVDANSVPVVLAFIDTERSYFRLKGALQNTVQGVIQGYWDLVQARTELWVIQQQIEAAEWANNRNEQSQEVGSSNISEVAQSRAQLANLQASAIAAEAAILDRVASLRGILGIAPGRDFTIVPTTPPGTDRVEFDWDGLVALAEERRPDLIELQLVLDADRQRILQARNQAQPQLDAVAAYNWNGFEGSLPAGGRLTADTGDFTDWTLAVNFSVPLTLRAARAQLRQNELLLASDETNLNQRLLEVSHELAFSIRSIERLYQQYDAFKSAREAAVTSLEFQFARFKEGITTYLDFLLAVNTWASSVTSEARSVTQLNTSLSTLELQTGTILETHGIRLFEERYCSLGPLGRCGKGREYPAAMRPSDPTPRYENGVFPSEEAFQLDPPTDELTRRLPDVDQEEVE